MDHPAKYWHTTESGRVQCDVCPRDCTLSEGQRGLCFVRKREEYAMDVADACHELGIETVAVTAGYIHAEPRRAFYEKIDAANVDLKAFTDEFYRKVTGARLEPVKDTLRYLVRETNVWTEITTL